MSNLEKKSGPNEGVIKNNKPSKSAEMVQSTASQDFYKSRSSLFNEICRNV